MAKKLWDDFETAWAAFCELFEVTDDDGPWIRIIKASMGGILGILGFCLYAALTALMLLVICPLSLIFGILSIFGIGPKSGGGSGDGSDYDLFDDSDL